MAMTYPDSQVTFPAKVNRTTGVPGSPVDANYFMLKDRLLEALQNYVGYLTDVASAPGIGSITGRIKRLEDADAPNIYMGTTTPTGAIENDLWLNLNDPVHWRVYLGTTWQPIHADAVSLRGLTLTEDAPNHADVLAWDDVNSVLTFVGPGMQNPAISKGDLLIAIDDFGVVDRLAIGSVNQTFQVTAAGLAAWDWLKTVELIQQPAPAVAPAGHARIILDQATGTLRASVGGSAYTDLGTGAAGGAGGETIHPFLLMGA